MMTTITRWARWWNIVSKPQTSLGSTQQVLRLLLDLPLHGLPGLLPWLDRCSHPAHHRNPSTGGAKVKLWKKVGKNIIFGRFLPPCLYMLTTFTSLASWDRSADGCENCLFDWASKCQAPAKFLCDLSKYWNAHPHPSGNKHLVDNALLPVLLPLLPPRADHQPVQASATITRMFIVVQLIIRKQ